MKILIVEDEPANLKLARIVLLEQGCEVVDLSRVEGAMEIILQTQPDGILLDLELPGLKGLDLARRLKNDPETSHIAIVASTAFPERYPKNAALDAGCDGYLVKPLNTRRLTQEMEEAVRRKG